MKRPTRERRFRSSFFPQSNTISCTQNRPEKKVADTLIRSSGSRHPGNNAALATTIRRELPELAATAFQYGQPRQRAETLKASVPPDAARGRRHGITTCRLREDEIPAPRFVEATFSSPRRTDADVAAGGHRVVAEAKNARHPTGHWLGRPSRGGLSNCFRLNPIRGSHNTKYSIRGAIAIRSKSLAAEKISKDDLHKAMANR